MKKQLSMVTPVPLFRFGETKQSGLYVRPDVTTLVYFASSPCLVFHFLVYIDYSMLRKVTSPTGFGCPETKKK